jgi:hypothetical protein
MTCGSKLSTATVRGMWMVVPTASSSNPYVNLEYVRSTPKADGTRACITYTAPTTAAVTFLKSSTTAHEVPRVAKLRPS